MSNARKLADNLPSVGQLSGRNVITNGGMTIDQRNSGSATTPSADRTYTLDRWLARMSSGSKYSVQQVTDAPSGYYKSLKVTSAAATTVGANDYYQINTPLEGYSVTTFDLGLSTAKKFTLSFWVKSSLTGTFGGAYSNNAGNRFYAWTYTISSANTWEHKTITVDGVTDGSWERTNGAGLWVYWTLGAGSSQQGTAGSWGTTFKRGPTGATNVVATNGATWQITGCQLEVGPQSTPFEHKTFAQEFKACQRYFCRTYQYGTGTGTATSSGCVATSLSAGHAYAGAGSWDFPTIMRTAPTITVYSTTNANTSGKLAADGTDGNGNATFITNERCFFYRANDSSGTAANVFLRAQAEASAEL